MEKKSPWQESLNLTVTEQVEVLSGCLDDLDISLSLGEMWIARKLDVSYSGSRALGALSYYHKRATVVLSQLRYWMEANGYVTSLTTQQVLMSWCGGSALLMELIENVFLAVMYEDMLEAAVPDMVGQVAALYPVH